MQLLTEFELLYHSWRHLRERSLFALSRATISSKMACEKRRFSRSSLRDWLSKLPKWFVRATGSMKIRPRREKNQQKQSNNFVSDLHNKILNLEKKKENKRRKELICTLEKINQNFE